MTFCEFCGEQIGYLPFTCKYCGGTFCKKHRLPENHECTFELKHVSVVSSTPKSSKKRYQDVDKKKPASQEYLDQGPKALKKYLKRQDRERKKTLKTYENNQKLYTKQTQFLGTKILFLMIIIFSIAGIIFSLYGLPQYMYMSLRSLIFDYTYHTFITSLFISEVDYIGFFLLIFMLMLLYFMARNIEARKGSKFLIKLYIISSLSSAFFYFILRLSLNFYIPLDYVENTVFVGFAWGGILGLLS